MIKEFEVSRGRSSKVWHQLGTDSWRSDDRIGQTVATENNQNINSFRYKSVMSCVTALSVCTFEVPYFISGSSMQVLKGDGNKAQCVTKLSIWMSHLFRDACNEFYLRYCEVDWRSKVKDFVGGRGRVEIKLNVLMDDNSMLEYTTEMELEATCNFKEQMNTKAVELKIYIFFLIFYADLIEERQTGCKSEVKEQMNNMINGACNSPNDKEANRSFEKWLLDDLLLTRARTEHGIRGRQLVCWVLNITNHEWIASGFCCCEHAWPLENSLPRLMVFLAYV